MLKTSSDILAKYKNKEVLVTGGLGMIGSFAATMAADYGANVTVLDNLLPDHGGNKYNLQGYEQTINTVVGDIRDEAVVNELVINKDIIFHCAAHVSYTDSMKNPFIDLDINAKGHLVLLEACRYHAPTAKVVFTSSRMKYGNVSTVPVSENQVPAPLMIYGAHKMLGEYYHRIYNRNYGINYSNLVVPNPFGPRQQMIHPRYGLVNWFIRTAMEGGEISIFGEGDQVRDYIYVEDIVQAIMLCGIQDDADCCTINLGNGGGTSFKEMVLTVLRVVGNGTYRHVEWPENYFNIETGDYIANIDKARSLGYQPSVTFQEGVERTFEYYKVHKNNYW